MNKKILIVGGAGYVGGYLVDLLSDKYDVTVYDNLLYENFYNKDVNLIRGDVRDKEKLSKILNSYDIVVWLAALVGDGACAVNEKATRDINEDSFFWFVDNCGSKIIYASTCSVYGAGEEILFETSEPKPLSLYAETKLKAERYLSSYHVDHLIFRLGTLYGVGDAHCRARLDLVANVLTYRACTNKPLKVFGGEQWRPLLHVKDVSRAIEYGIEKDINGLYNLVDTNSQIKDIAEEIKKIIPSTKIIYEKMPFEDQRNYRASGHKYSKNGFKTKYSLIDGIMDIKKLFEEKRIKNPEDPLYYNVAYLEELQKKKDLSEWMI
jgi:nucleoside-diphosphate-sugar epimerase